VFTTGTAAQLTLNYVDIKADSRLLPVVAVDDGSEFVIKRTAELASVDATLPLTGVVALNGLSGATIPTSSISRVDGYDLQIQFGQAPAQPDVKIEFDIDFPSGGGFPEIYETPIKFEESGAPFVGFISPLEATKVLTDAAVGTAITSGTVLTVVNPTQGAYGVKARFLLVADGGLSYTLPATVEGAKLAVPLTLSAIQGGLETNLSNISSVRRNSFRTLLSAPSVAGQSVVTVNSTTGIQVGAGIYVGAELKTVSAIAGASITLNSPLAGNYAQGQLVTGDDRYTVTLSGSPVASGQNIYVEAALEVPAYIADPKTNGVSRLFRTVVARKPISAAATLFVPLPGLLLGRIVSTVCSSVFVDGLAEPSGGVTVAAASGGLQLTFTTQKTGLVEVVVQVEYELDESLSTVAYYSASVPALVPGIPATAELELLAEPKLLVHTKGTGGADTSGTFTELPFVRDPNLTSAAIALNGGTAVRPFIADVPVVINKLGSLPLFAGRKFQLQDLQAAGFEVEGVPLSASLMHRTVLMAYVNYQGTRLLLVVERNRLDNRTRVSSDNPDPSAPQLIVGLYQPNGRPIAVN
jgi:hypothetical protein